MGCELPVPAPAPERPDGPPTDLLRPSCRLQYRPRDLFDQGVGPWRLCWFPNEPERVAFVTLWQHDFEMRLSELSDPAGPTV